MQDARVIVGGRNVVGSHEVNNARLFISYVSPLIAVYGVVLKSLAAEVLLQRLSISRDGGGQGVGT